MFFRIIRLLDSRNVNDRFRFLLWFILVFIESLWSLLRLEEFTRRWFLHRVVVTRVRVKWRPGIRRIDLRIQWIIFSISNDLLLIFHCKFRLSSRNNIFQFWIDEFFFLFFWRWILDYSIFSGNFLFILLSSLKLFLLFVLVHLVTFISSLSEQQLLISGTLRIRRLDSILFRVISVQEYFTTVNLLGIFVLSRLATRLLIYASARVFQYTDSSPWVIVSSVALGLELGIFDPDWSWVYRKGVLWSLWKAIFVFFQVLILAAGGK